MAAEKIMKAGLKLLKPNNLANAKLMRDVASKRLAEAKKEGLPEAVIMNFKNKLRTAEAAVRKQGGGVNQPLGKPKKRMATAKKNVENSEGVTTKARAASAQINATKRAKVEQNVDKAKREAMVELDGSDIKKVKEANREKAIKRKDKIDTTKRKVSTKKESRIEGKDFVAKGLKKPQAKQQWSEERLKKAQRKRRGETAKKQYDEDTK